MLEDVLTEITNDFEKWIFGGFRVGDLEISNFS